MKIDFKNKYLGSGKLLEHVISEGIGFKVTEDTQAMLDKSNFKNTGLLDITMTINGTKLESLEMFFEQLEKYIKEQSEEVKFSKWKEQYISKNSDASKKEKIIQQLNKTNQLLTDIKLKL